MTRSPILTLAGILVTVWCVFELFKWHYISARTVRNPYGTRIYLHSPLPPSANGDVHAASALLPGWAKGPSFYFEVLHDPSKATKRGSILDEAVASLECDGVILLSGTIPTDIRSRFTDNHILYASRHRYCALRLTCQNDGDFRCVNYHFWRYLAAWRLMNMKGLRSHARILMLDTDAIFTNVELSIPTLLSRFSSIDGAWTFAEYDPSVVVSADASCYMSEFPINSGVVILKNSPVARMAMYLMMQLSDARDFLKNRRLFGANMLQDQPILVHVASDRLGLNLTSIQEYCNTIRAERAGEGNFQIISSDPRREFAVVSPRGINSFHRKSCVQADPNHIMWHEGDYIAHLSGMPAFQRGIKYRQLCRITPEACPSIG